MHFLFNSKKKSDPHKALMQKVSAYYSCANDTELEKRFKNKKNSVLLCECFEEVLAAIREDKDYFVAIIRQADAVLSDRFYMLYRMIENAYDKSASRYKWDIDYKTGYQYRPAYFTKVRQVNKAEGADIKRVWEFARLQYLFAPAMAYRLTGDERYAQKVKHVLSDFIKCNPLDIGANWNLSMEVGIRAANILLAFELIRSSSCVDGNFIKNIVASLLEHRNHILKNEENTSGLTSNHYLGGLLGIAVTSAFCPDAPGGRKALAYVTRAIEREIVKQIHPDGGDYEGSTSYQRLVGELILFTLIVCRKQGLVITSASTQRLRAMAEYTAALSGGNGFVPQIGDNDCGRVFQLLPEDNCCHMFYMGLLAGFLDGGLLEDYKNGLECFIESKKPVTLPRKKQAVLFAQSGLAVVRGGHAELFITANETQSYGGSGGHTHNDLLAFVLRIKGREVIADSGTGGYTGDAALRNCLRSTAAHSTIMVNAAEQRIFRSDSLFAWGSKSNVKLKLDETENSVTISGSHDGYFNRFGRIHKREFIFSKVHRRIDITDYLGGEGLAVFSLPLGENVSCRQAGDNAWLLEIDGQTLRLESSVQLSLEKSLYSPAYDCVRNSSILRGYFTKNTVYTKITWNEE